MILISSWAHFPEWQVTKENVAGLVSKVVEKAGDGESHVFFSQNPLKEQRNLALLLRRETTFSLSIPINDDIKADVT